MSEMKTVRTSELIGAPLDWAVAKTQGVEIDLPGSDVVWAKYAGAYSPSTNWNQGGPLIGKHGFDFEWVGSDWHGKPIKQFCANGYDLAAEGWGDTHLIAACRAIVAANLGDEVQIPAELLP